MLTPGNPADLQKVLYSRQGFGFIGQYVLIELVGKW